MLSIIVATNINGGIGKENDLLFHIKEDLKRFKDITSGSTIIMGRKTYESLPNGALPNRTNIVISRSPGGIEPKDNLIIINELCAVIMGYVNTREEAFVIGGGEIYKQLLPYCDKIYLTKVHSRCEADTFFEYNKDEWEQTNVGEGVRETKEYYYEFIDLKRKSK